MKATIRQLIMSLVTISLCFGTVYAAPWDKSDRIEGAVKKYKLDKVETISGTVTKVIEKVPSFGKKKNDALGYHILVQTETDEVDVHLGPTWYLVTLEGQIDVGDFVHAVGSVKEPHVEDGKQHPKEMRAAEIRKGDAVVLKLRDADGRPVWSGYVN